ncbi:MAG: hypothetical protein ACYDG4_10645 [Desulfuromonadaceae bacterium]
MIVKSCPNGCDPEDRLDIYNFHDDEFKFCPMCGAQLAVEERPDPDYEKFDPKSLKEVCDCLRSHYHPKFLEALGCELSPMLREQKK